MGSFDERENKVRQARCVELPQLPFALQELVRGRERQASIRRKGIHVTIKQPPQKDDRTPRVVIADESRNALKMAVLRHRHTAKGAWGCVIVLYGARQLQLEISDSYNSRFLGML